MTLHTIDPVWNENSKVLILGSFPSVKSREEGFFYGHKQNRFWRVLASVCDCSVPQNIDEKKSMLLANGIAFFKQSGSEIRLIVSEIGRASCRERV